MEGSMDRHEGDDSPSETFDGDAVRLARSEGIESTSPENLQHTQVGPEDAADQRREAAFKLTSGAQVGRYVVLHQVGAGAMGVVYAAYDPELDRKLAIKLLRPRAGSAEQQSAGRTRLLREAQALAKLRHPNVVAVHDVGTYEGRVYVAMEFVEGQTLGEWLRKDEPGRDEIVRVFVDAGRGLAAAHRAGLIHRDFKPDNVLIARDASVRVLDFGLARATGERVQTQRSRVLEDSSASEPDLSSSLGASLGSSSALSAELTRTGGVMGTPAYMAPEQHLGLETTAASDQFAFGVALYEALYGERPFGGRSVAALAFAVTQGKVKDPPSGSDVPRWLRAVVVKALHPESAQRHASMDLMLDALGRDPAKTWRRVGLATAALALVGVAAWQSGSQRAGAPTDPCAGVEAPMAAVWSPARATELGEHFRASDLAFAELSAQKVGRRLDVWAQSWVDASAASCRETRVQKTQSEGLFDRRAMCLERALGRTKALVNRLVHADDEAIERASEAVDGLPDLELCADKSRLMALRAPLEGAAREEGQALAATMDEVEALVVTGEYKRALETLTAISERVEGLADPATTLRHAEQHAQLQEYAEDDALAVESLKRAYLAADRAGDDWSRARLATDIMETYGHGLAKAEFAAEWDAMAAAAVDRLGRPVKARAHLSSARGSVQLRQAKYDEGIETLTRAVAEAREAELSAGYVFATRQRLAVGLREKGRVDEAEAIQREMLDYLIEEVGPEHPRTAVVWGSLGNSMFSRARYAEAAEYYEKALSIIEASFGADSPRYYDRLNNYAAALMSMGKAEEAEAIHRKILAYNTERFGPEDVRLTPSLENIGNTLTAQGRHEEAKASYTAALELKTKHFGADHPTVATSKMNLGVSLFQMGELDEAERLYHETLEVWRAKLGPEHADLGLVYTNLGDVHEAKGRYRSAAKYYADAARLFAKAWGEDNVDIGWPMTGLGLARLGMGDVQGSLEAFERARELRERPDAALPEGERARMDFGYARALAREGKTEEARRIAQDCLADARAGDEKLAERITRWLAAAG